MEDSHTNNQSIHTMKRRPYLTLLFVALALLIHLAGMDTILQWSRPMQGEPVSWLMYALTTFTSHFAHWNTSHLLWNVLAMAVLGTMIEQHTRRGLLACVLVSCVTILAAFQWISPAVSSYRGLSGIDSGLFVMAATLLIAKATNKTSALLPCLAMAAFVSKTIYELASGRLLFVGPEAFIPCPLAHIMGGGTGLLVAVYYLTKRYFKHEIAQLTKCIHGVTTSPTRRRRQGHTAALRSSHLNRT